MQKKTELKKKTIKNIRIQITKLKYIYLSSGMYELLVKCACAIFD